MNKESVYNVASIGLIAILLFVVFMGAESRKQEKIQKMKQHNQMISGAREEAQGVIYGSWGSRREFKVLTNGLSLERSVVRERTLSLREITDSNFGDMSMTFLVPAAWAINFDAWSDIKVGQIITFSFLEHNFAHDDAYKTAYDFTNWAVYLQPHLIK